MKNKRYLLKARLSETFNQQIFSLVEDFRRLLGDTADFTWVNPEYYSISLGYVKCGLLCTKRIEKLHTSLNNSSTIILSIEKLKEGLGLYHSDSLYFSLKDGSEELRKLVNQLRQEKWFFINHPFIPRIDVAYQKMNYGIGATHNVKAIINILNSELKVFSGSVKLFQLFDINDADSVINLSIIG